MESFPASSWISSQVQGAFGKRVLLPDTCCFICQQVLAHQCSPHLCTTHLRSPHAEIMHCCINQKVLHNVLSKYWVKHVILGEARGKRRILR